MQVHNEHHPFDYRILLVDDDVDDQYIFSTSIRELHDSLQVFTSGFNALFYLKSLKREDHPSIIVLDYHMPGMDGLEMLRRLKANSQLAHIPVIVYSSDMNSRDQAIFKLNGAIGCFKKSETLDELKEFLMVMGVVFEHGERN